MFAMRNGFNLIKINFYEVLDKTMGRGGQEGALAPPPWPAKIVCFSTFLNENSLFLGIFLREEYVFAPLENFALPGKKVCGRPWTKPRQSL